MIERLRLEPLPGEGGFFRRTWAGADVAGRPAGSAILFLMTETDFSALHRLDVDELWYFHAGDPVEHVQLGPAPGAVTAAILGANLLGGHQPQLTARAGAWQGARLLAHSGGAGWSLMSTSMAPAWRPEDFELGNREALLEQFPRAQPLVRALTRIDGF